MKLFKFLNINFIINTQLNYRIFIIVNQMFPLYNDFDSLGFKCFSVGSTQCTAINFTKCHD